MKWLFLFVGVIVICFVVALILGLAGGGLGRTGASLSHEPLPEDPIQDADFDDLVFDVGARGYRMSQVDGVVDRLRRELREKDEEIAVLRGEEPSALPEPADEPADERADELAAEGVTDVPKEGAVTPDAPDEPSDESEPVEQPAAATPSDPTVGRERTT